MSEFLTLVEVLAIHQDQIERYGGAHGVRAPRGILELRLTGCGVCSFSDFWTKC